MVELEKEFLRLGVNQYNLHDLPSIDSELNYLLKVLDEQQAITLLEKLFMSSYHFKIGHELSIGLPKNTIRNIFNQEKPLIQLWIAKKCSSIPQDIIDKIINRYKQGSNSKNTGIDHLLVSNQRIEDNFELYKQLFLALLQNPQKYINLSYTDYPLERVVKEFLNASPEEQSAYLLNPGIDPYLVCKIIDPKLGFELDPIKREKLIFSIVHNKLFFESIKYRDPYFDDGWYQFNFKEFFKGSFSRYPDIPHQRLFKCYKQIFKVFFDDVKRRNNSQDYQQKTLIYEIIEALPLPKCFYINFILYKFYYRVYIWFARKNSIESASTFSVLENFLLRIIQNQQKNEIEGDCNPLLKFAISNSLEEIREETFKNLNLMTLSNFNYYFPQLPLMNSDYLIENKDDKDRVSKENYTNLVKKINILIDSLEKEKNFYALLGLAQNLSIPAESLLYLSKKNIPDPLDDWDLVFDSVGKVINKIKKIRILDPESGLYSIAKNRFSQTTTENFEQDFKLNYLNSKLERLESSIDAIAQKNEDITQRDNVIYPYICKIYLLGRLIIGALLFFGLIWLWSKIA